MRRILFMIATGLVFAVSAQAQNEVRVSIEPGLRRDFLNWNIAGGANGDNPNIISELTWRDVLVYQVRGEYQVTLFGHLYVRTELSYGWITSGNVQDSDFSMNYRFGEFSRSVHNAGAGHTMDLSSVIGFKFPVNHSWVAPVVGYGGSFQNLTLGQGTGFLPFSENIFVYEFDPDSTYDASWIGPIVGIDGVLKSSGSLSVFGGYSYQWARFNSIANWKLRSDFKHPRSFTQIGNSALHRTMVAGAVYEISRHTALSISYRFQNFSATNGTQYSYFVDDLIGKQKLNQAQASSRAFSIGFVLFFPLQ